MALKHLVKWSGRQITVAEEKAIRKVSSGCGSGCAGGGCSTSGCVACGSRLMPRRTLPHTR